MKKQHWAALFIAIAAVAYIASTQGSVEKINTSAGTNAGEVVEVSGTWIEAGNCQEGYTRIWGGIQDSTGAFINVNPKEGKVYSVGKSYTIEGKLVEAVPPHQGVPRCVYVQEI